MSNPSIIPGLTDDAAELCLAFVPRFSYAAAAGVCRRWRSFVGSEHFSTVRKSAGVVEEFLCVLMESECGREVYWEVFDGFGNKLGQIPPVPGPVKRGFGVAVLPGGKIVFMGGYTEVEGSGINSTVVSASADVYEYNPRANRWSKLADMNTARYNFACVEVKGLLYAVRGYSNNTFSLSTAEIYNPETNKWTLIECPNRPVWRGFAFSFNRKLYAIGNGLKSVDVYDPETHAWVKIVTEESVSVYSHTVVNNKVYFMDRNMPGCLRTYCPGENAWGSTFIPSPEGSSSGFWFKLGSWKGMVLLFPHVSGHETLMYDPTEGTRKRWRICHQIKPSGSHLCSVLIEF